MPQCNPYIHDLVCLYNVRVPVSLSVPFKSLILKQACVSISASGTDPLNPRLSPSDFSLGLSTQAPNSSIHPLTHLVLQKYLTCVFVTPLQIPSHPFTDQDPAHNDTAQHSHSQSNPVPHPHRCTPHPQSPVLIPVPISVPVPFSPRHTLRYSPQRCRVSFSEYDHPGTYPPPTRRSTRKGHPCLVSDFWGRCA